MTKKIEDFNPAMLMSIGYVAKKLAIPVHTIRFWTNNFPHIKCFLGKGDRRYYDSDGFEELKKIYFLINERKMRLEGIKNMIKYNSIRLKDDKISSNDNENNIDINLINRIKTCISNLEQIEKTLQN
jgi:DNA-binding transcriptional MerR regulator